MGVDAAATTLAAPRNRGGRTGATQDRTSTDPVAVTRLFDGAETAFGRVDVLVNNAGIRRLARLADNDDALFDSQFAAIVKGTLIGLREASRRQRRMHRQFLLQRRRPAA
jgi:3-oxoacyl-[acyl-carrier protein] reductase